MQIANLNHRLDRLDRKARTSQTKAPHKFHKGSILIKVLLILVLLFLALYLPARSIISSAKQLSASAKGISAAAKNENLDQIEQNVNQMEVASDNLNNALNWYVWMKFIPYFGGYYSDAKHFSEATKQELLATQVLVKSLDPYKQELGFTGTPNPNGDRVSQMLLVLDKILPQLDTVAPKLKIANDQVASIDVNKYPDKIGHYLVKQDITAAKNAIMGAYLAVTQARPFLEVVPGMLGEPNPKTYLVLFQNDKELRATGGFLTAYTFLTIDHGHISSATSDDIYHLDEQLQNACKYKVCPLTPPTPISLYLPEANGKPRTSWSIRDSNFSPDLPTSMQEFEKLYDLIGNPKQFDGIITIDTQVVESLIALTGPITFDGTTYSDNSDPRCNCANVIFELENYSEIVAQGQSDRKAILGTLMQQLLNRVLHVNTQALPQLITTATDLASQKHVMLYMHDQSTESALSDLGWTGQVKPTSGDYLMINDSNFAGGKSNLYVTEDVELDINTNSSGGIDHKLTINYANPQPYNIWLNDINRDYVRVYVPQGSQLVSTKGSSAKSNTADDLGKTYFDGFIQVRPQNSITLSYEYTTPASFGTNPLPLLIQKQGGTKNFHYVVKVNGQTKAEFDLDSDKQLSLH